MVASVQDLEAEDSGAMLLHSLVGLGLSFSRLGGKLKTLFQVNSIMLLEEKGLFIIWGFCFALTSELKKA